MPYFIGLVWSKKCCQKLDVQKKDNKGWGSGCLWKEDGSNQLSAHYDSSKSHRSSPLGVICYDFKKKLLTNL